MGYDVTVPVIVIVTLDRICFVLQLRRSLFRRLNGRLNGIERHPSGMFSKDIQTKKDARESLERCGLGRHVKQQL
jgi:hypothetical protein